MKIWIKGHLGQEGIPGGQAFVELAAEQVSLRELLAQLGLPQVESQTAPGPARRLVVLLNGRHVSHLPQGLDTPLRDGDKVDLFPPVAGG